MTDPSYSQFIAGKNGTGDTEMLGNYSAIIHCNIDYTDRDGGRYLDINLAERGKCQVNNVKFTPEAFSEYFESIDNAPIYRACDSENVRLEEWMPVIGNQEPLKFDLSLSQFRGTEFSNSLKCQNLTNNAHKRKYLEMEYGGENNAEYDQCQMEFKTYFEHLQIHQITDLPHLQNVENDLIDLDFTNIPSHSRQEDNPGDVVKPNKKIRNLDSHYTLLCPFCGTAFPNLYFWRKHVNEVHEFGNYQNLNMEFLGETHAKCRECNAVLTKHLNALQLHRIKHLPFSRYVKCNFCGKGSTRISPHLSHLKSAHLICKTKKKSRVPSSNFLLLCPFCGIQFTNSSDWREHLNVVHEFRSYQNLNMESLGGKKAKCRQCNAVIKEKLNCLQGHKITHLPFSRYVKCQICERKYAGLRSHGSHFRKMHSLFDEPNTK